LRGDRHVWASRSAIVQGDQLGDASGALAALDLDREMIVHAQAVRRHVLRLGDSDKAAQPRALVTCSNRHFPDGVGNDQFGFRDRHDLADADIRCGFQERRFTLGESDDSHVRHDQTYRPCRR
jgi:hypothetical protein